MKKLLIVALLTLPVISTLLTFPACGRESRLPDFSGNTTGTIYVDYIKSYQNIGELAAAADLIATGTIDRTVEVVPPDEAAGDTGYPGARIWLTRSAFRVERVIKGDAAGEIIISQTGATGRAEERGNPVFEPGERYFLFLREGSNGIYHLIHPLGRFRIKEESVYSMNYILPTGQSRPPLELMFWKTDLEDFIGRVTGEIPD